LKDKKVAILFNKPGMTPGFEDMSSSHIQLPLETAAQLDEAGYPHVVITTTIPSGLARPVILDKLHASTVYFVPDPNKQGASPVLKGGQVKGVYFLGMIKYLLAVRKIIVEQEVAVLHVFGTRKFALSAIFLRLFSKIELIWTTETAESFPTLPIKILLQVFYKKALFTTKYVGSSYTFLRKSLIAVRGVSRKFEIQRADTLSRVLFWRDASYENGADIALSVFQKLAPRYEEVEFTFAVRPHWSAVVRENDCSSYKNIKFIEFPYPRGTTIESLLGESICVVFPFRELSTNPQLALVETLYAGIPVICSSVQSNAEMLGLANQNYELNDEVDKFAFHTEQNIISYLDGSYATRLDLDKFQSALEWHPYIAACQRLYRES
jgi:hypothetical protein